MPAVIACLNAVNILGAFVQIRVEILGFRSIQRRDLLVRAIGARFPLQLEALSASDGLTRRALS